MVLPSASSAAGWTEIGKGVIQVVKLEGWIKEYFGVNEDLLQFKRRNDWTGLEITAPDDSRGYVFVGPIQLDRNFEKKMERKKGEYERDERVILRKFVDYSNELAGFSWRRE